MMAQTWSWGGWLKAWNDTEWSVWLTLILIAVPYAIGVARLWRHAGYRRGISVLRVTSFITGTLLLALALASPLDTMSESLFAAHMTQHLLLVAVVPPLLIAGAPGVAWAWLWRGTTQPVGWAHRLSLFTRPARAAWLVFVLHALAMWAWHLPSLYRMALASSFWHAIEHACFLVTALLLWWVVMEPRGIRRNGYAVGVLLMLGTAMQSGALGALLASTNTSWYSTAESTSRWGLNPTSDQQLAGLIMWIPGGMIYVLAACVLFVAWMNAWPTRSWARTPEVAA